MQTATVLLALFISLFLFSVPASAQFFFPFAMGQAYQPRSASGYAYSNGYGVKDAEGYFPLCRGWTCTSST
ncbi:unnamed protein product [Caenorhabditis sp. 36 PRJEB53466]|nr:unnamed protein product [Caenorhabditis sp. 36 PRJEB53466]